MTAKELFFKICHESKYTNVRCEYCKLNDDMTMCANTDCLTGWNMYWIALEQMYNGEYC